MKMKCFVKWLTSLPVPASVKNRGAFTLVCVDSFMLHLARLLRCGEKLAMLLLFTCSGEIEIVGSLDSRQDFC